MVMLLRKCVHREWAMEGKGKERRVYNRMCLHRKWAIKEIQERRKRTCTFANKRPKKARPTHHGLFVSFALYNGTSSFRVLCLFTPPNRSLVPCLP